MSRGQYVGFWMTIGGIWALAFTLVYFSISDRLDTLIELLRRIK